MNFHDSNCQQPLPLRELRDRPLPSARLPPAAPLTSEAPPPRRQVGTASGGGPSGAPIRPHAGSDSARAHVGSSPAHAAPEWRHERGTRTVKPPRCELPCASQTRTWPSAHYTSTHPSPTRRRGWRVHHRLPPCPRLPRAPCPTPASRPLLLLHYSTYGG